MSVDHFALSDYREVRVNASAAERRKVTCASGDMPLRYSYEPGTADSEWVLEVGESQTFDRPVYLRGAARGQGINVIVEPA